MEQSTSITVTEESDGEECTYDEMLQYLPCRKYPEGATNR